MYFNLFVLQSNQMAELAFVQLRVIQVHEFEGEKKSAVPQRVIHVIKIDEKQRSSLIFL